MLQADSDFNQTPMGPVFRPLSSSHVTDEKTVVFKQVVCVGSEPCVRMVWESRPSIISLITLWRSKVNCPFCMTSLCCTEQGRTEYIPIYIYFCSVVEVKYYVRLIHIDSRSCKTQVKIPFLFEVNPGTRKHLRKQSLSSCGLWTRVFFQPAQLWQPHLNRSKESSLLKCFDFNFI